MSTLLRVTAAALVSTVVFSSAALAAGDYVKNHSLQIDQGVLSNPPVIVYVPKNGKYQAQKEGSYSIKMRWKAQRRLAARIIWWQLDNLTNNVVVDSSGFSSVSLKKLDKTIVYPVSWNQLKHFESAGRKVCEKHGDPDKKIIKTSKDIRFKFIGSVKAKPKRKSAVTDLDMSFPAYLPVRIVCMPVPFKITEAKLSVKYHSNPNKCPVRVTLKAAFKGNKPGSFKFNLYRGDGEFQNVTRTIGSTGKANFSKDYTFTGSIDRKYMVAVLPSGASTGWVPMKVNCGKKPAGGGFQTAPKPHNN